MAKKIIAKTNVKSKVIKNATPRKNWDDDTSEKFDEKKELFQSYSEYIKSLSNRDFKAEILNEKEKLKNISQKQGTVKKLRNETIQIKEIKSADWVLHKNVSIEKACEIEEQLIDITENYFYGEFSLLDQLNTAIEKYCEYISDELKNEKINASLYIGQNDDESEIYKNINSISFYTEDDIFEVEDNNGNIIEINKIGDVELESINLISPLDILEQKSNISNEISRDVTESVKKIRKMYTYTEYDSGYFADLSNELNRVLDAIYEVKTEIDKKALSLILDALRTEFSFITEDDLELYIKAAAKIENIKYEQKLLNQSLKEQDLLKSSYKVQISKGKTVIKNRNNKIVKERHTNYELQSHRLQSRLDRLYDWYERIEGDIRPEYTLSEKERKINDSNPKKNRKEREGNKDKEINRRADSIKKQVIALIQENYRKNTKGQVLALRTEVASKVNSLVNKKMAELKIPKRMNLLNSVNLMMPTKIEQYISHPNVNTIAENPSNFMTTAKIEGSTKSRTFDNSLTKSSYNNPDEDRDILREYNEDATIKFMSPVTKKDSTTLVDYKNAKGFHSSSFIVDINLVSINKSGKEKERQLAEVLMPEVSTGLRLKYPKGGTLPKGYEIPKNIEKANNRKKKNKLTSNQLKKSYFGCLLAATYFQVLVSNTPVDEDYDYKYKKRRYKINRKVKYRDENGKVGNADKIANEMVSGGKIVEKEYNAKHKADNFILQADWILQFRGKNFKAYESEREDNSLDVKVDKILSNDLFLKKNDYSAIEKIAEMLFNETVFIDKTKKILNYDNDFNTININPRYNLVENGGYFILDENGGITPANSPAKYGSRFPHGTKQGYTYQAPRGMKRLTDAVFQNMTNDTKWENSAVKTLSRIKGLDIDFSDSKLEFDENRPKDIKVGNLRTSNIYNDELTLRPQS